MACEECGEDRETTEHTIWYFDHRDRETKAICGPCTRRIREDDDNGIRSLT